MRGLRRNGKEKFATRETSKAKGQRFFRRSPWSALLMILWRINKKRLEKLPVLVIDELGENEFGAVRG